MELEQLKPVPLKQYVRTCSANICACATVLFAGDAGPELPRLL